MSEHKPIGAFDSEADRVLAQLTNDPKLPYNRQPKKPNWLAIIIGGILAILAIAYLIFGTSCHRVESTTLKLDSLELARRDTVYPYLWPNLQTDLLCIVGDTTEPSLSPTWFQFYKDSITIKERPDGPTYVKLIGEWRNKRQFIDSRCGLIFVQLLSTLEVTIKADETWYKFYVSP